MMVSINDCLCYENHISVFGTVLKHSHGTLNFWSALTTLWAVAGEMKQHRRVQQRQMQPTYYQPHAKAPPAFSAFIPADCAFFTLSPSPIPLINLFIGS
jgi:hypothetical protein